MVGGPDEAWLRLWRLPGVGPARFNAILEAYGEPAAFLAAPAADRRAYLTEDGARALEAEADPGVASDLEWLTHRDHHLVHCLHPRYPEALNALTDRPPLLFVQGDPALLNAAQLGMVGSRKATRGGAQNAHDFARHLAGMGLVITSGLALGIDAAAHEGALDGGGYTVAVVATGPDRVYPAQHRALARRIAERGALITEFPTGVGVRREYFPRRNRLISGLSLGTLVVEAGLRSGSLVTARHALEQGREVFAIPGSIHNPVARGCHALIRQGAKLVESADDILEELPPLTATARDGGEIGAETAGRGPGETDDEALDADYAQVLDALGHDPQPIDVLSQRTGLTPDTLSSMLLLLELRGRVAPCNGGRYVRVGK